jgi:hypothetical protein
VQKKYSIKEIPASPSRNIDCGMIGSICACYPLQIFVADDERIVSTLDTLTEKFFHNGLFFQQFIHSGMNIYLTLQIAHSFLYSGNREEFWEIFNSVLSMATPTFNYPEAIHPLTGGGIMGDGHHGWAAAEIVSAFRDAVYEKNYGDELILLRGIPGNWFEDGKEFRISNVPVPSGNISIYISADQGMIKIKIDFMHEKEYPGSKWIIYLPFKIGRVISEEAGIHFENQNNGSVINLHPGSIILNLQKTNDPILSVKSR